MADEQQQPDRFLPLLRVSKVADECILEAEKVFGAPVSEFDSISYLDILLSAHPGIKTHFSKEGWPFHTVEPGIAYHLSVCATRLEEAFALVREICARNIACGEAIPDEFRTICSLIIRGDRKFVFGRGKKPTPDFALKWACIETARYLSDAFNIPISRGDGMAPISACDAVAEALERHNIPAQYTLIRDWLTHGRHKKTRERAEQLSAFVKDEILLSAGASKRRHDWVLSPFGQMLPFGRIT
jgi:hypothetical protein